MDSDPVETEEWLDAFRGVLKTEGVDRARFLIEQLRDLALAGGAANFCPRNTPYVNTIPISRQLITRPRAELAPLVQRIVVEGTDAACYKPFDVPRLLSTLQRLTNHDSRSAGPDAQAVGGEGA